MDTDPSVLSRSTIKVTRSIQDESYLFVLVQVLRKKEFELFLILFHCWGNSDLISVLVVSFRAYRIYLSGVFGWIDILVKDSNGFQIVDLDGLVRSIFVRSLGTIFDLCVKFKSAIPQS